MNFHLCQPVPSGKDSEDRAVPPSTPNWINCDAALAFLHTVSLFASLECALSRLDVSEGDNSCHPRSFLHNPAQAPHTHGFIFLH